jgi:LemA protein
MNTIWIIGGALFLFALWMFDVDGRWIGAGSVALLAWTFNSLVSAKNQADTAFASVGVMLQKRHDLIPNLVAAVQRYVEHESQVLEDVTRLRALATSGRLPAEKLAEVEGQIGRALAQLVATAESYPELKASENFQQLQRALNEAEEQLSAARRTYNAAVKHFNDGVQMFPTNLLARLAGYAARPYFEVPSEATARPDVGAQFRAAARR